MSFSFGHAVELRDQKSLFLQPGIPPFAKRSFGVVQVGDTRGFGCFLIRKGTINECGEDPARRIRSRAAEFRAIQIAKHAQQLDDDYIQAYRSLARPDCAELISSSALWPRQPLVTPRTRGDSSSNAARY